MRKKTLRYLLACGAALALLTNRYQFYPNPQCPVCDAPLSWRRRTQTLDRINATKDQHYQGCPAAVVDPARLRRSTREQALAIADEAK